MYGEDLLNNVKELVVEYMEIRDTPKPQRTHEEMVKPDREPIEVPITVNLSTPNTERNPKDVAKAIPKEIMA